MIYPSKIAEYKGHNPQPVALTGIVPTKATNENGNIAIGDILVSSSKKGHAMKANEDKKTNIKQQIYCRNCFNALQ